MADDSPIPPLDPRIALELRMAFDPQIALLAPNRDDRSTTLSFPRSHEPRIVDDPQRGRPQIALVLLMTLTVAAVPSLEYTARGEAAFLPAVTTSVLLSADQMSR
ncbi:MAG TPA: hypothetical protein VFL57_06560 [Bryobacteraceae bacterium]|nr:hypothetical protein [Bryobacteraceae bacterium]